MKLSSKYTFLISILTIILSGVSLSTSHQGFALKLIITAFAFLSLAVLQYLWEIKAENED